MTVLALGLLVLGLLACLYILVGFPAEAQVAGDSPATVAPTAPAVPAATTQPLRRRPVQSYPASAANPELLPGQTSVAPALHSDAAPEELETQLNTVRDQLAQSQEILRQADRAQRRTRVASALFLAVFAVIAALIVIQVYIQARGWDSESSRTFSEVETLAAQLEGLRSTRGDSRSVLPGLLQDVGEQPLSYQEEGAAFAPRSLAIIDDIDHLAYVGQGRLAFRDLSSQPEAAVYLNGLLLSAVSRLARSDPWTAFSRLDQFFSQLGHFPDAVERLRIAQAYSYRGLAAYQVLEAHDRQPSWMRKADRAQLESLSKQAFADIALASSIDPEWKHATFVEALLCGRFYLAEETDNSSRSDLLVRGLRRAVTLYKGLIDERSYRGPARRNLVRALKRIAEETGEKSDFSDFGYALNAFPSDEELADEALAARQPGSQDRFLWQWMLGDEELFANVERLNLAEYRAFWIRMLDNKVHLRNWRADLGELQQANPAMKDWTIQLLQSDPPISLSNAISRRQERYDSPASGA